jgi:hypothetical protein
MLKSSLLYFLLVFGAGFLLGPIRVLLLEPSLGAERAELIEMPVMLVVILLAARWIVRRLGTGARAASGLGVGLLAVVWILAADTAVGVALRGMSPAEVFTRRGLVSGLAYYGLLAICALLPWWLGRRSQPPAAVSADVRADSAATRQPRGDA